ncbi:hypothetical protein [Streptomyces sp. HUAS TT7]|uniref:hypothetical protein n=1 Tax=Streptomyces sp. HUAS TT7 TaxID=3447507 RepID=UPI003F6598CA
MLSPLHSPRTLCAVGAAGVTTAVVLAVTGVAHSAPAAQPEQTCSTATLTGTYLFAGDGLSVSGTSSQPLAFAGSEHFDAAGHVRGTSSSSFNGTITRGAPFTGTYTVNADCTGTLAIGTTLHFDLYTAPSGDFFTYIQTDPGSVSATTEHRATRT